MNSQDLTKILELGVRAPSGDNSQPWKFIFDGENLTILNLKEKDNEVLNYKQAGSYVAHGGLIENIVIAAASLGFKAEVKLFPEGEASDAIATLNFQSADKRIDPLFNSINKCATNRRVYENKPLPKEIYDRLVGAPNDLQISEKIKSWTSPGGFNVLAVFTNEGDFYKLSGQKKFFYLSPGELKEKYHDWQIIDWEEKEARAHKKTQTIFT